MSSDLLAEFDSFYRAPNEKTINNTVKKPQTSAFDDLDFFGTGENSSISQPYGPPPVSVSNHTSWGNFSSFTLEEPKPQPTPQDDIWGDFEGPASPPRAKEDSTSQYGNGLAGWNPPKIKPTPTTHGISTDKLFSNNIDNLVGSFGAQLNNKPPKSVSAYQTDAPIASNAVSSNPNILFDADDEFVDGDEDDFGDFETVRPPTAHVSPPVVNKSSKSDLFGLNTPPQIRPASKRPQQLLSTTLQVNPYPYPQAPKSPSFQERNPFAALALATEVKETKNSELKRESPVTAWPVYEPTRPSLPAYEDSPITRASPSEDWGHFEDLPPVEKSQKSSAFAQHDAWDWDAVDGVNLAQGGPTASEETTISSGILQSSTSDDYPPTNIPPPSVLLSMFPQLLNLPKSSLFQAVTNQPFSLKNRIMSDPSTIDFLNGYILVSIVGARIIAGRKLRWKRDTILSQAMKIGPAAVGGKGGMKLTGVDKAETTREDREAAELVRVWMEQVGRLRSAVAIANSSMRDHSSHLTIPEISEVMPIKTEGSLTAPKPCVLCGLKRNERIARVDVQVEDSFGEWWTEYWGHRACRNFWQEHEKTLKKR